MSDTPRTDALITELGIFQVTSFDHILNLTKRHVVLTRKLEVELRAALTRIAELEEQLDDVGFSCSTVRVRPASAVFSTSTHHTQKSNTCKKCGGEMRLGKAIEQTWTAGALDFPGDTRGVTMSPGGKGKLVDCLKCTSCGWSVIK